MILIGADILIDVLRGHAPATIWVNALGEPLSIVGFAAMELLQGCRDATALRQINELLDRQELVWPTPVDCTRAVARYGPLRLRYGLDVLDALIVETAIGLGEPLHTFNIRHFAAYADLVTVQPYPRN